MTEYTTKFYENDDLKLEVDGKRYRIDVSAKAEAYYYSGCMYRPDPPDYSFDIVDMDMKWFKINSDGSETEIEPTEKLKDELYDYLYDCDSWVEEEPEPPEPVEVEFDGPHDYWWNY